MLTKLSLILLVMFAVSILAKTDFSLNQDLGRHLKLGEIIIKSGSIPKTNLFSYTNPDFPFINHHYLFEVTVYLLSKDFGLSSLLILKYGLLIISASLTLWLCFKKNKGLLLPVSLIFLPLLRERTDLRPELFSFIFTALTYFLLDKNNFKKTRWVYFLPFIQLLWINLHIYFPVGLILQGIYLFYYLITKKLLNLRRLSLVFILSILLSLLNPNLIQGFLYPLNIFNNYGYTVAENQNIFLLERLDFQDPNFIFAKLAILITVISLIISLIKIKFNTVYFLLSLTGVSLALTNIRGFPYLFLITMPSVLGTLSFIKYSKITLFLTAVSVVIMLTIMTSQNLPKNIGFSENGKNALDFVIENNLAKPIYNNFDIGSYLIYRLYPNTLVFVDGRPEAYPADFFRKVYIPSQENPGEFSKLDQKVDFQTIIFSHTDQTPWARTFLSLITKDPNWKTVYLDDFMIVLTKVNHD